MPKLAKTVVALAICGAFHSVQAQSNDELFRAVDLDNASYVRKLLDQGIDPNTRDKDGNTPLIKAADGGYQETIKVLLDHKADPNLANKLGENALMMAAIRNHPGTVKQLVENGAAVNKVSVNNKYEWAPIHYCVWGSTEICEYLLSKGADINAPCITGASALMLTVYEDRKSTFQMFLSHNPDLSMVNDWNHSVYDWAAKDNRKDYLKLLPTK